MTFSPHLAFVVPSVADMEAIARQAGFACWQAGSLPRVKQLWVQLARSFVIELQEAANQVSR